MTAKEYDLKLRRGRFQTIIPKLSPVAGISLVTALTGEPFSWASLGAASFGYLCDLGKGKLELEMTEQSLRIELEQNPIVHLFKLEEVGAVKS